MMVSVDTQPSLSSEPKDQLLAVLFVDIERFSGVMEQNHRRAVEFVMILKDILDKATQDFRPAFEKPMGDGWLMIFEKSSHAAEFALKTRGLLDLRNKSVEPHEQFQVRIGLHHGELTKLPHDYVGNSINIASRVMAQADPGGMALTRSFYDEVRNKVPLIRQAKGTVVRFVKVKNIKSWVSVFVIPPGELKGKQYLRWWARRHRLGRNGALGAGILILGSLAANGLFSKPVPSEKRQEVVDSSSPPKAARTEAPTPHAKLAAAKVAVQALSMGRVKLDWEPVPEALGYYVYFRRSEKDEWNRVRSVGDGSGKILKQTSVTCWDFRPGPAQFIVLAVYGDKKGSKSNMVEVDIMK